MQTVPVTGVYDKWLQLKNKRYDDTDLPRCRGNGILCLSGSYTASGLGEPRLGGGSCTIYREPDFEKWVRQFSSCFCSQTAGVGGLALPLDYAILRKFYSLSVLQLSHL